MTKRKEATLTIKRLAVSKLKPHPRNPRIHPDPGTEAKQMSPNKIPTRATITQLARK